MPVRAQGAQTPAEHVPTVFSTAGLPAARRVELWESHNAAALIGLRVLAAGPLEATEFNVTLPGARLARVAGCAHAVERTPAVISRCPADSVAVYLTMRGDAWFADANEVVTCRPGDALVCETDEPFARRFARGLEELVITVPRAALSERAAVPRLAGLVRTSFSAAPGTPGGGAARHDPYARALARITGRATRTGSPLPPDERTVLDLVTVLVAGRNAARAAAHRAAAHLYIEENLTDPDLGADEIAAAVGISKRQLSRVFAADSTSIPRHILSGRLRLAYAILSGGAVPAGNGAPVTAPPGVADVAGPVRIHVAGILLARVPAAFRPPGQRHRPPVPGGRGSRWNRGAGAAGAAARAAAGAAAGPALRAQVLISAIRVRGSWRGRAAAATIAAHPGAAGDGRNDQNEGCAAHACF